MTSGVIICLGWEIFIKKVTIFALNVISKFNNYVYRLFVMGYF